MKKLLVYPAAFMLIIVLSGPLMSNEEDVYPGNWTDYHRGLSGEDYAFPHDLSDTFIQNGLYIQIRFDDGSFMFGSFFVYKAGPLHRYGVFITHVDKAGKRSLFKEEVPDKKVLKSGPPFKWKLNRNCLTGNGNDWNMILKNEGLDAKLNFKRLVPGWKPGDGITYLNRKKNVFFYNALMVPAARVTGHIKINGKDHLADGYGYIDRVYQNPFFTHLSPVALSTYAMPVPGAAPQDRWFFYFTDNYGHKAFNKIRYRWLLLIRNDKIVFATKDFTTKQEDFRIDPAIKEKTPFRYVIRGRQGKNRLQLVTQSDTIIESMDVFSELPIHVKRVAQKFLRRPVYFRLNSTVTGNLYLDGKTIPVKALGMSGTVNFK